MKVIQQFTDAVISFLKNGQRSKSFHFFMAILIAVGLYGVANVQIDNYLTDEINKNQRFISRQLFLTVILEGLNPSLFFG